VEPDAARGVEGLLAREIEELRERLSAMRLDDMAVEEAERVGAEIAVIRGQLRRLETDRARIAEAARRATHGE
jgi:hypothetical protein